MPVTRRRGTRSARRSACGPRAATCRIDVAVAEFVGQRLADRDEIVARVEPFGDRADVLTQRLAIPQVRDWFQRRLTDAGFTLKTDGDGLSGRTEENKPFRLELDGGADRAKGTIVLGN